MTYSRTHRRRGGTDRCHRSRNGHRRRTRTRPGTTFVAPAVTDARLIRDPAINEVKNLAAILPRQPVIIDEVVLVDGDSKDDTVTVTGAHLPNVRVVGQDRPGQGAAPLRHGFFAFLSGPLVGHRARGRRFRDRDGPRGTGIKASGAIVDVPSFEDARIYEKSNLHTFQ